jgi:methionine synthase I (cobalamin-dependent)
LGLLKGDADWQDAIAAGINLAREPEWDHLYTLGSIGSAVGNDDQYESAILSIADVLASTDALLLETQIRLDRVRQLTNSLIADTLPPLMVSFSFSRMPKQDKCWVVETINGVELTAADIAQWAKTQPLLALGANCGNNLRLSDHLAIVKDYRQHCDLPLFLRPGITASIECEFSPKEYAAMVKDFADAGVTLLGGCCGTTPMHIAHLRQEIDHLGLSFTE